MERGRLAEADSGVQSGTVPIDIVCAPRYQPKRNLRIIRICMRGRMAAEHQLVRDCTGDAGWIDVPVHRSITSKELMAGEQVIIISHGQEEYRLRLTASGKLILTR